MIKQGQTIPAFSTIDQNGKKVSTADWKGKRVVLYFYPQDNTPTCTIQACNIRDNYQALLKSGYVVYGISPDSAKRHQNFISKFSLPFDLLVDEDHKIADKFSVWVEKKNFGKTYMGIARTTFIIDEAGKVEEIISKVVSKEHSDQILSK